MNTNLADLRTDYKKARLTKKAVHKNPIEQFKLWLNEAIESEVPEPTAMIIATVSAEGRPSTRTVLLKGVEQDAFIFYTNYQSKKATHLAQNPNIAATIFWKELERQVHIEGQVDKVASDVSDAYFESRPWKSRIGARISPQSMPIESREVIKVAFAKEAAKYTGRKIPRPDHWGGYAIHPRSIEFWQGRSNRLHDRIRFTLTNDQWQIERLAP